MKPGLSKQEFVDELLEYNWVQESLPQGKAGNKIIEYVLDRYSDARWKKQVSTENGIRFVRKFIEDEIKDYWKKHHEKKQDAARKFEKFSEEEFKKKISLMGRYKYRGIIELDDVSHPVLMVSTLGEKRRASHFGDPVDVLAERLNKAGLKVKFLGYKPGTRLALFEILNGEWDD